MLDPCRVQVQRGDFAKPLELKLSGLPPVALRRNCVACVAQACEFSIPVVSSEPLKETKLRGWGNCSGRRSFVKYHDSPDCFAA